MCAHVILSISQRRECVRSSDRASAKCQWTFDKYAFADHFYIGLRPFFRLYFKFLASQHTFFLWMNLESNCCYSCVTIRRNFTFCLISYLWFAEIIYLIWMGKLFQSGILNLEANIDDYMNGMRIYDDDFVNCVWYLIRCVCDVRARRWKQRKLTVGYSMFIESELCYKIKILSSENVRNHSHKVRLKTNHILGFDLIDRWYTQPPLSCYIFAYIFSTPRDADSPETAVKITWISLLALCLSLWAKGSRCLCLSLAWHS